MTVSREEFDALAERVARLERRYGVGVGQFTAEIVDRGTDLDDSIRELTDLAERYRKIVAARLYGPGGTLAQVLEELPPSAPEVGPS